MILSYEQLGYDVDLGENVYSRKFDPEQAQRAREWGDEVLVMMREGRIEPLPVKRLEGFEGVIEGMEEVGAGRVRGNKLVGLIG